EAGDAADPILIVGGEVLLEADQARRQRQGEQRQAGQRESPDGWLGVDRRRWGRERRRWRCLRRGPDCYDAHTARSDTPNALMLTRPVSQRFESSTPRSAGRLAIRWAAFALLFWLALLPRLLGLGEGTTEDEDQWIARSGGFARALQRGRRGRAALIGPP